MALTQSARLPGPSWDEEVVPALRKRLESESRTLSRRMSAVSLNSTEDPANYDTTMRDYSAAGFVPQPSSVSRPGSSSDRKMRVNGTTSTSKKSHQTPFQRSRTYSQPYLADLPNGNTNGNNRTRPAPKHSNTSPLESSHRFPPRPSDIKPTRIPKAAKAPGSSSSNGHSPPIPGMNGHGSPDTNNYPPLPGLTPDNASRSTVNVPSRQPSGILNEPPPFKPSSMSSSIQYETNHGADEYDEAAPRPSNDSEELPFEHWYRGDISRNGGVGELRVGKRMEMLEIANYGHTLKTTTKASSRPIPQVVQEGRRRRKRADSVAGIGTKERERGSLYLDEDHAREVGRVLDEDPPTDLDGEASDAGSMSEHYYAMAHRSYDFNGGGDMSTVSAPQPGQSALSLENRSTTPTPATIQRPSSRSQNVPPTRIPGPPSRQSTDTTRVPTPTQMSQMSRGSSEPPSMPSSSRATTPSSSRQPQPQSKTPPPGQKRGVSPAATPKKSRMAASKATKAKTLASRKELEAEANRKSVAYYPTPAEGDMMEDAIPSWTQPVRGDGNWDDVVLPVVARKKGLDGQYEQADGSPKPQKPDGPVAPAPGTFGYDHTKYRPPRGDHFESIPMDEFGRPTSRIVEESEQDHRDHDTPQTTTAHEETRLPVRHPPPPSPAPFADYAPTSEKVYSPMAGTQRPVDLEQGRRDDEDESGAGCCKCVVM